MSAARPREQLVAAARPADGGALVELLSPSPGLFRFAAGVGDLVRPGRALGELELLGRLVTVTAPDGVHGTVVAAGGDGRARPPVDYGAVLVTVDPRGLSAEPAPVAGFAAATATAAAGRAFRAPTSGRFYGRPSPGAPPFVSAGDLLAAGATVCLLEVMKTFHRVTYTGEPARVREVAVPDGADVNAGDALLLLEDPA